MPLCCYFFRVARLLASLAGSAIELRGEPVGLKDGGLLRQVVKKVSISCPDFRIPKSILVRIGAMRIGDAIKASDLALPDYAQLATPADTLIAELYDPRKTV